MSISSFKAALSAGVLFVAFAPRPVDARFARVDIDEVPVARVLNNLKRDAKAHPDAEHYAALGRAHALAWALGSATLPVEKGTRSVWYGHNPSGGFGVSAKPGARSQLDAARAALGKALALAPYDRTTSLTLAWVVEQSGDRKDARTRYRALIASAPDNDPIAPEAAGYLVPLLDATKDTAEIANLHAIITAWNERPRKITPILVGPTANAGLAESVDERARVRFDLDGTGPRNWGWIRKGAAWLVYAPDGRVDSALRMFGNVTFWLFWSNGYQALASLDDNGDGRLTGRELLGLALWRDDGDGVVGAGELERLDHARAILVRPSTTQPVLSHPAGVILDDGSTLPTFDWVAPSN